MEQSHFILLNIGHSVHQGDWNWQGISSPFTRIYYVDGGRAKIHFQNRTQELNKGFLYLIPPFVMHSYECSSYFSHYYIHLYENELKRENLSDEFDYPTEVRVNLLDLELVKRLLAINPDRGLRQFDPKTYDNRTTLMRNIAEELHESACEQMETKGFLLQLYSRFLQFAVPKKTLQDERIERAVHYICKHIDENLSVTSLAEQSNISNDHFIRLFKKELGLTPMRYINQRKIERAQLMLVVENFPIKDIAYKLSFENISYFNRVFKQYSGLTPMEYYKSVVG